MALDTRECTDDNDLLINTYLCMYLSLTLFPSHSLFIYLFLSVLHILQPRLPTYSTSYVYALF